MTAEQKQHLLAYLGLYTGEIDGAFGSASKEATRKFQEARNLKPVDGDFGPITEKEILKVIGSGIKSIEIKTNTVTTSNTSTSSTATVVKKNTGTFWDNIKYFERDEFVCKCNGVHCKGDTAEMNETLMKFADRMREYFNAPVIVTSGIRCKVHNANSGGVANSDHLYGRAMDFKIPGKSATTVLAWVNKQPEIKYAYDINGTCVHVNV